MVANGGTGQLESVLYCQPWTYASAESLVQRNAEVGLAVVSHKTMFSEGYYRDVDRLESKLIAQPVLLSNWRLGLSKSERERDQPGLEVHCRYNATARGIRVLRQRMIFVFRKAEVAYYPVDRLR